MSDLRPQGIKIKINGREYELLFTIRAIDEIQEKCNMPLIEAIGNVAEIADGHTDAKALAVFYLVLAALISTEEKKVELKELDGFLKPFEFSTTAWKILEAYGFSVPDPGEEDEESEDEDPNRKTGQ